jgi:uncharacterized protein YggE
MSYLFILLSFLFVAKLPSHKPRHLSVTVTGKVHLTADQVIFNINVNAEGKTPKAAYNLHKSREKALVNLLDKYDIKEKNIQYEPVSIREERHRQGNNEYDTTYVTHQQVKLTLSNFDVFTKIQIGLIEHDYDDFSAHFTSSKIEKGKDEALKAAIKKARAKARLIAAQSEVELGPVQQITYSSAHPPAPVVKFQAKAAGSNSGSMLKYQQTVTVSATISIQYKLYDNK